MKENDRRPRPEALDETLNALADPTRRAILRRLMRGEARVTELARPFAISLNAVSKHIRMLEHAGLVHRRRLWREHWLSFCPAPLDEVALWIDQTRGFWTKRLEALDVLLKSEAERPANSQKHRSRKKGSPS